ncbi:MAG: 23S rRNA (uracil(1939)-C(5))-methyltransferase RlmD [Desulfuromonadales bacterium]|nr:23S rRNA (uracil(1939)-C(5))-methyltransferase RlmD [Desulfuromonadales bacterium]
MAEIIRDLDIISLVHGGRGIGHHDGKAVFVPLTLPGDRVACRVVKSKRRYVEAELDEIVVPSPLRREPPCPFFGSCGGCQWQHMPYLEQAGWKEKIFIDLMVRSKVIASDRLKPIVPAPDEWGYRNRVQLKCSFGAEGLAIGFYRHGSHLVVDVDKCRLVAAPIQRTLGLLRRELPGAPCADCVSQVDVACGDDGEVRVILYVRPQGRQQLRSWLQAFAACHRINACIQAGSRETLEVVHGLSDLIVKVDQPEIALRYGPGGFVQVNSAQNRSMVAAMLELVALDGTEIVLDLFCGMGNFSLPLARRAKRVIGVEDHAPSIASARLNAAANNVGNVEFHAADAAVVMARPQAADGLDLVVLDPPRTGNYQVAGELLKIRPERILYVSCDPATLARDLAPLIQGGYEVVSSQPFDLFPQTWHIESMTLLRKSNTG